VTDDGSTDDVLCATYRALCRHGYADLTTQDIADEWSKSKPALHYHYDTKRDLLVAFLEHLLDSYTDHVVDPGADAGTPRERLAAVLDAALDPPRADAHRELRTALFEIKAQAPYDDAFRDRLAEFDAHLHAEIRGVVRDGIAAGAFRADADPDRVATLLTTVVDGAYTRRVALGDDGGVRAAARACVDGVLEEAEATE
jgi:AcrR family transcriptional regulator